MTRLSPWGSGRKTFDFKFFDRTISEFFSIGGTAVYVHLFVQPYTQNPVNGTDNDMSVYTPPLPNGQQPTIVNQSSIQDVLFLENRDRQYSNRIYELRGIYNVNEIDFDLRQFGLFITNDTMFVEFHMRDMVALCGRRLIAGDVLEFPHQRDEYLLNGGPAINKFYVVEDANRASDGYSATWYPHIWRVKCSPMPATQEYQDILNQQAKNPFGMDQGTIGSLMSTLATEMGINQEIFDAAQIQVPARYYETQQFWIVPGTETGKEAPWIFAGDGIPPNGAISSGSGNMFPLGPSNGEYYLRTDYCPPTLFMYDQNQWIIQEVDWRGSEWNVAHRLLESFINNNNITTNQDGSMIPEKVNASQALKPTADF